MLELNVCIQHNIKEYYAALHDTTSKKLRDNTKRHNTAQLQNKQSRTNNTLKNMMWITHSMHQQNSSYDFTALPSRLPIPQHTNIQIYQKFNHEYISFSTTNLTSGRDGLYDITWKIDVGLKTERWKKCLFVPRYRR